MDGGLDRWMDFMDEYMGGWVGEQNNGYVDGGLDLWMSGEMGRFMDKN